MLGMIPYHGPYLYIYMTVNYLKYRCWFQSPPHLYNKYDTSLYIAIQAESNSMILSALYSARKVPVWKF